MRRNGFPARRPDLFPGFAARRLETTRGTINALVGGNGPPLLLLHGYPESSLMWHASRAAARPPPHRRRHRPRRLRDSFRPAPTSGHAAHSKRALALDQVEAMAAARLRRLRRGRARPRRARGVPDGARPSRDRARLAVLDIVPTGEVWGRADAAVARGYWHWSFLALPAPLPERLIAGDPDAFFELHVRGQLGLGERPDRYPLDVLDAYRRTLDDPGAVEAMCEDYRAGATVDAEHDDADRAAGRVIACPVLVLWSANGGLPRFYPDVLDVWRPWAPDVRGTGVDATHFLAEDDPEATADHLLTFLRP